MVVGIASSNAEVVIAVFTAITTFVLLGSAIAALWQLRETQRTRSSELIVEMTERWEGLSLRSARREMSRLQPDEILDLVRRLWEKKATPTDERLWYRLTPFPSFVEVIAVIEGRQGLSLETIDELWGGAILGAWDKWASAIEETRKQPHAELVYSKFEDLARRIRQHRSGPPPPSPWAYRGVMAPPPR